MARATIWIQERRAAQDRPLGRQTFEPLLSLLPGRCSCRVVADERTVGTSIVIDDALIRAPFSEGWLERLRALAGERRVTTRQQAAPLVAVAS